MSGLRGRPWLRAFGVGVLFALDASYTAWGGLQVAYALGPEEARFMSVGWHVVGAISVTGLAAVNARST